MSELKALSAASTPGFWLFEHGAHGDHSIRSNEPRDKEWPYVHYDASYYPSGMTVEDSKFIAALVTAFRSGRLVEVEERTGEP